MKKILVAAVAAFACLACATAEVKSFLDFGITVPVLSNLDCDDGIDSETTSGVGFDLSYRAMFTENVGLYANAGLILPQKTEVKGDYEYTLEASDTDSWVGFNGFIGCAIMPVNKDKFGLTVAPGLVLVSQTIDYGHDVKTTATMLGLGCNVGFDIYLNDSLYIKPAIGLDLLFHDWTEQEVGSHSEKDDEGVAYLYCKPSFSFGFRF